MTWKKKKPAYFCACVLYKRICIEVQKASDLGVGKQGGTWAVWDAPSFCGCMATLKLKQPPGFKTTMKPAS